MTPEKRAELKARHDAMKAARSQAPHLDKAIRAYWTAKFTARPAC